MTSGSDSLDALRDLVGRPSRRRFSDEPVPRTDVERMIDVARRTGSARNRQPWRFVAVTDAELRARLAACGAYARHLAGAPLVLVVVGRENGFRDTAFDLGRVAQSLILAAAACGYDTCLATFYPDDNVDTVADLLGIGSGWRAEHALSVGRAREVDAPVGTSAVPTGRHAVADLLTWT
ncbi:nitroreductase family protein [Prauserella rugosa]|uniref:Nitroreductase n=1 Tax=Prauserella rugosa TaxID=43354 RepID=A0A660CNC3_9PSEU|nr:nitroreductase family protein [Prauserella rugosa]KMS92694.1 hypothetical protein ACZ91_02845 [Streptomyces regensis]TWH22761.1 nitroreductase [Prauserella rugosa]